MEKWTWKAAAVIFGSTWKTGALWHWSSWSSWALGRSKSGQAQMPNQSSWQQKAMFLPISEKTCESMRKSGRTKEGHLRSFKSLNLPVAVPHPSNVLRWSNLLNFWEKTSNHRHSLEFEATKHKRCFSMLLISASGPSGDCAVACFYHCAPLGRFFVLWTLVDDSFPSHLRIHQAGMSAGQ